MPGKASKLLKQPESTVLGLYGRRGSGKSCLAAWYAISAHKAGYPVFFTPESYLKGFGTPLDLDSLVRLDAELQGALVVLDEVQTLLNSRRSMAFASFMLSSWLVQVRKRRCRVIYTTQMPRDVDKRLVDQTDIHAHCRSFNDGETIFALYTDTQGQWSPWLDRHADGMSFDRWANARKTRAGWLRRADQVWPYFDTYAVADLMDILGLDRDRVMRGVQDHEETDKLDLLREEIAVLVGEGVNGIHPGNFSKRLEERRGLRIAPQQLGHLLSELGLPKTPKRTGAWYFLPTPAEIDDWKAGVSTVSNGDAG